MSDREDLAAIDALIHQAEEEEDAAVCTAYSCLAIAKSLRLMLRRRSIF